MKIAEQCPTVTCLVKAKEHQPLCFIEKYFGVGKYFNFMLHKIEETYQFLVEHDVKVNALEEREKQKMEIL
ncbi:hypothetical protein [Lysinibacillus sp. Y5S-8]|uniref:hypothetical protein n=1 Tax=Lysinibacillus sp. Y5S-8 TaxID=3122488 RepID=UPI0030D51AED